MSEYFEKSKFEFSRFYCIPTGCLTYGFAHMRYVAYHYLVGSWFVWVVYMVASICYSDSDFHTNEHQNMALDDNE